MMMADMSAANEYYDWLVWSFDSAGIPLNLLVDPDGPIIRFPELVTQGTVHTALDQAAANKSS